MKKLMIITQLICLSFVSCSKDENKPAPTPIPTPTQTITTKNVKIDFNGSIPGSTASGTSYQSDGDEVASSPSDEWYEYRLDANESLEVTSVSSLTCSVYVNGALVETINTGSPNYLKSFINDHN